ncbi:MAG: hypothetical protein R3181_09845 [Rubricoccaceae bacterium]|nr:hypothetical protein [Rubricoccaceae bacterium]
MTLYLADVALFDSYCDDPTADNCIEFADGALPVYLSEGNDGEPVLYPGPGRFDEPFGLLHILHGQDDKNHPVVVTR